MPRGPVWHQNMRDLSAGEESYGSHWASCSSRNQPPRGLNPTHCPSSAFPCPLGPLGSCFYLLASDGCSLLIYRAWFGHTSRKTPRRHTPPLTPKSLNTLYDLSFLDQLARLYNAHSIGLASPFNLLSPCILPRRSCSKSSTARLSFPDGGRRTCHSNQ